MSMHCRRRMCSHSLFALHWLKFDLPTSGLGHSIGGFSLSFILSGEWEQPKTTNNRVTGGNEHKGQSMYFAPCTLFLCLLHAGTYATGASTQLDSWPFLPISFCFHPQDYSHPVVLSRYSLNGTIFSFFALFLLFFVWSCMNGRVGGAESGTNAHGILL